MSEQKAIAEYVRDKKTELQHNHTLFDIYEGNLLKYVEQDLIKQLSASSFEQARHRIPPINVLTKIIDKLAKIYQKNPTRTVEGGNDSDKELVEWYAKQMRVDQKMNIVNEFFNLYKSSLYEIFINKGVPQLRAIPNDRFLVWSNDPIDPTRPTHYITIQGEFKDKDGKHKQVLHVWTDEQFYVMDSDGNVMVDRMAALENFDAVNPFGVAPFVYVNRSHNLLMPMIDSDMLKMTKLFPVLLSDLNFAVMFQAFSVMYGIDLDDENLEMSPNAFWRFKSDPNSDRKPEIGQIKPQIEIERVLSLIQAELSFWLNTKGIKPGAVGQVTQDNFASGVSKMIDEMDTSEERQKQIQFFKDAEAEMWDKTLNYLHPYWVVNGLVENRTLFTPSAEVITMFPDQLPLVRRGDMVDDLVAEVEAGFTTKRRAIKMLNPEMSDEDIDGLLGEIEDDGMVTIDAPDVEGGDIVSVEAAAEQVTSPDQVLNGAQVSSLVEVINQVSQGLLPRDSAIEIIRVAFAVSKENAEAMLGSVGRGFTPSGSTEDQDTFNT